MGSMAIPFGLSIYIIRDFLHPVVLALLAIFVAAAIVAIVSFMVGLGQVAKEHRAGYTTSPSGWFEFDQVDPRTGVVIRQAGEPKLSRQESRLRRERALAEYGPIS